MKFIKLLIGVVLLIPFALLDTLLLVLLIFSLFEGDGSTWDECMIYGLSRWLLRKMGWIKTEIAPSKAKVDLQMAKLDRNGVSEKHRPLWIEQGVRVVVWTIVAALVIAFFVVQNF